MIEKKRRRRRVQTADKMLTQKVKNVKDEPLKRGRGKVAKEGKKVNCEPKNYDQVKKKRGRKPK